MRLALSLALPFMALLLFVNMALGVISRVAPQQSQIRKAAAWPSAAAWAR